MRGGVRGTLRLRMPTRPSWALTALMVPAVALLLLLPGVFDGTKRPPPRLTGAAGALGRRPPLTSPAVAGARRPGARRPGGPAAVGALFTVAGGALGKHFCTATVVDSPGGDLVITAAHCVSGRAPGQIAFVPGYHDGRQPYGAWAVSRVIVDPRWRTSADPDDDVAFLVVHKAGDPREIQRVTGGERLGTGWPARVRVQVTGYPDRGDTAISCERRTRPFGPSQMKFVCGGFTDGTSGGPFLAGPGPAGSDGTVIGVIGGYERGGNVAWVSYSPRFGSSVRALYDTAVSHG